MSAPEPPPTTETGTSMRPEHSIDTIPTLTVWQPWASLFVLGEKHLETRGWPCYLKPGTLLALHAAKRPPLLPADDPAFREALNWILAAHDLALELLPRGAVLGTARFVSQMVCSSRLRAGLSLRERLFGDYSNGRYAWRLEVVEVFPSPIPATGRQGIWRWQRPQ